jgi:hypothetical protein
LRTESTLPSSSFFQPFRSSWCVSIICSRGPHVSTRYSR